MPRKPCKPRAPVASEDAVQRAAVQLLAVQAQPCVFWCHIPNGGQRSAVTGALLKALGTKAGVPDLLFIVDGHPLFLELKRASGGRVSPA